MLKETADVTSDVITGLEVVVSADDVSSILTVAVTSLPVVTAAEVPDSVSVDCSVVDV